MYDSDSGDWGIFCDLDLLGLPEDSVFHQNKIELPNGSTLSVGDTIKNVEIRVINSDAKYWKIEISSPNLGNLLILDCDRWITNGKLADPYQL